MHTNAAEKPGEIETELLQLVYTAMSYNQESPTSDEQLKDLVKETETLCKTVINALTEAKKGAKLVKHHVQWLTCVIGQLNVWQRMEIVPNGTRNENLMYVAYTLYHLAVVEDERAKQHKIHSIDAELLPLNTATINLTASQMDHLRSLLSSVFITRGEQLTSTGHYLKSTLLGPTSLPQEETGVGCLQISDKEPSQQDVTSERPVDIMELVPDVLGIILHNLDVNSVHAFASTSNLSRRQVGSLINRDAGPHIPSNVKKTGFFSPKSIECAIIECAMRLRPVEHKANRTLNRETVSHP